MDDSLAFPVLAGAALTQGIGFLYGQLEALLERRRAQRESREVPAVEVPKMPEVLAGRLIPFQVDDRLLAEKAEELSLLQSLLAQYAGRAEVDGHDPQLRILLGRLRVTLERIYGQYITFKGEARPSSGIRINQAVDEVKGKLVGLDVRLVGERIEAEVSQTIKTVHSDASVIGARFDTLS